MTVNAWIAYVVAGAWLLVLGALAVVLVINADQRAALAAGDAARSLLQSQNSAWAQKAAAADASLARIKTADAANAQAIAKAEIAAAAAGKKLKDEAATIGDFKFSGSDCDQAAALGRAYLERLQ